jgi:hypothetical protein
LHDHGATPPHGVGPLNPFSFRAAAETLDRGGKVRRIKSHHKVNVSASSTDQFQ